MRVVESPNCDDRPDGVEVSLVVLHSISLPPGEYGGDSIERLFTNGLDPAAHPYFAEIRELKVSSHFLVRRDLEHAISGCVDDRRASPHHGERRTTKSSTPRCRCRL